MQESGNFFKCKDRLCTCIFIFLKRLLLVFLEYNIPVISANEIVVTNEMIINFNNVPVLGFFFRFFFDERLMNIVPVSVYLSSKLMMYITWFLYLLPCILFSLIYDHRTQFDALISLFNVYFISKFY